MSAQLTIVNSPRRCSGPCDRLLPESAEFFHVDRKTPSGFTAMCRECRNGRDRKRYHHTKDLPRMRPAKVITQPQWCPVCDDIIGGAVCLGCGVSVHSFTYAPAVATANLDLDVDVGKKRARYRIEAIFSDPTFAAYTCDLEEVTSCERQIGSVWITVNDSRTRRALHGIVWKAAKRAKVGGRR